MNRIFEVLLTIDSRFLNLGFLALALLGSWIDHWIYFLSLFAVAGFIATLKFFHDKKWIASADKYIRVVVIQSLWSTVLFVLLLAALGFIYFSYGLKFEFLDFLSDKSIFAWTFLPGFYYYGDYFIKFVDSVKTFDEGIQLPGRKSEVIPWNEIYAFTDVENHVTISSSKGEHEFDIDPEDYRYTRAIIADWKLKNGRRNLGL